MERRHGAGIRERPHLHECDRGQEPRTGHALRRSAPGGSSNAAPGHVPPDDVRAHFGYTPIPGLVAHFPRRGIGHVEETRKPPRRGKKPRVSRNVETDTGTLGPARSTASSRSARRRVVTLQRRCDTAVMAVFRTPPADRAHQFDAPVRIGRCDHVEGERGEHR